MIKVYFKENVFDTILHIAMWTDSELQEFTDEEDKYYWIYLDEDRIMLLNITHIRNWNMLMKAITHELLHFIGANMRRKGIDYTWITEEVYCYMYDFYFGKIREWLTENWFVGKMNLSKMVWKRKE